MGRISGQTPAAQMDRQYRKRGAAGPRPGGPGNIKEAITLIGLNPFASAALLQTTTRGPRWGTDRYPRHTGEVFKRYSNAIPANAKECDHERRWTKPFRDPEGNAIDGGGELRAGPQELREVSLFRATGGRFVRGARHHRPRRRQGHLQQGDRLCRKERAGLARLRPIAPESQGSDRSDAAAQRICAGPDALAGGAGQRNGPDRQPGRDGSCEAEKLAFFVAPPGCSVTGHDELQP